MSFPPEVVVSIASVMDLKPIVVESRDGLDQVLERERPSLSKRQTTRLPPSRKVTNSFFEPYALGLGA